MVGQPRVLKRALRRGAAMARRFGCALPEHVLHEALDALPAGSVAKGKLVSPPYTGTNPRRAPIWKEVGSEPE